MGLSFGAYLKKPITDKISDDETNGRLKFGASCMQGWRVSQEDAHNCLLDFDVNTSLFAVYDGHGGAEVAVYCSQKLPDYIKNTEAYKEKDFEKALIDAFLGFDATITTDKVIAELQKIAKQHKPTKEVDTDSSSSDIEENIENLCEEATMPLNQVLEKYDSTLKKSDLQQGGYRELSVQAKALLGIAASNENSMNACTEAAESAGSSAENSKELENGLAKKSEADVEMDSECNENANNSDSKCTGVDTKSENDLPNQNGAVKAETPQEHEEMIKKGKGKAILKTEGVPITLPEEIKPKTDAQLDDKFRKLESESDSEDEEESGEGKAILKTEGVPITLPAEIKPKTDAQLYDKFRKLESESDSEDEEESEDSSSVECPEVAEISSDSSSDSTSEVDEAEELVEEDDYNCNSKFGFESGCTAVVALLHECQLYVANAGDSRCVVCRDGKAVEMSFDHKPLDKPERDRIEKAGGRVSGEGRVDGNLNLSRAIGDHYYKRNKKLSDREQKITALPDIRTLTINPKEDEFMVLACDGIWNSMTSQAVVDFVRPKIQTAEKLSQICEEMFDHCLAPHELDDSSGCDNMTAIIVQFKKNLHKRSSDEIECESIKRSKTGESTA